jgi:hypothetical protein
MKNIIITKGTKDSMELFMLGTFMVAMIVLGLIYVR